MSLEFKQPESEGLYLGFETAPDRASPASQHIVWIHLDHAAVVEYFDSTTSLIHVGTAQYRVVGRTWDVVNALSMARREYVTQPLPTRDHP